MFNPFEKRATEYLRDDESFLSAITPAPLSFFLSKLVDRLFDRLVVISGTPGSGKTTVARLVQYRTVQALLRHRDLPIQRVTEAALTDCGFLHEGRSVILACRLGLGSEYRDFWELPYPEPLKDGLLRSMLQARTCLAWMQNLLDAGHSEEDIVVVVDTATPAAVEAMGGTDITRIVERARAVERAIYDATAALIAPPGSALPREAVEAYRPFDALKAIRVTTSEGVLELQPLIIFDDAHELHPAQFNALERWLVNRELLVARWIMTRIDAFSPERALKDTKALIPEELQRVQMKRDVTEVRFQTDGNRRGSRKAFQKMAKDMAGRYLKLMTIFQSRSIESLEAVLSTTPRPLSEKDVDDLQRRVQKDEMNLGIDNTTRGALQAAVRSHIRGSNDPDLGDDVQLAMYRILLNRYAVRNRPTLFEPKEDATTKFPAANSGVAHGGRIHLLHKYGRPYFYGLDAVCDIGSENAELFLQIAGRLVEQVETRLIRNRTASLEAVEQNRLLRDRGSWIMDQWRFPESEQVLKLIQEVGELCLERTLEPNAPLGAGANAIGVPQDGFYRLTQDFPYLAKVLQYAVAYNAVSLVFHHKTKHRTWCLIELGGAAIAHYGLPLIRGGFVESQVRDLAKMIGKD